MSQALTPRVFVSATSSDLRSARKVVNDALTRIECLPIEESVFGTEYGPIREMLARKIASCQAVIHLVGRDFGGEPDSRTLPAGQPRRSWTQIEYDLAKEQKRKLYLLVCDGDFSFDPFAVPEPADKSAVQFAHRQAVLTDPDLWHTVRTADELRQAVERMKIPLDEVRAELRRQQIRHRREIGLVASTILPVLGGVIYGVSELGKKVVQTGGQVAAVGKDVQQVDQKVGELPGKIEEAQQETVRQLTDPAALAETIRKQIRATVEEKIKALPDEQGRWRKVAEIEKERDLALGRVDDLIKLIQEGLKEGASPVFQKATEILQKEGTDEALAYLESSRPSTLDLARRHAEQAKAVQARADAEKEQRNKTLQALVLEAELLETKLQWRPALQLHEQVAELAPDWFAARNDLGNLHCTVARFRAAEAHLQAAVKLAATAGEEAIVLNNMAMLFKDTNRLAEAEPLMRRVLALDEQSYGAEHYNVASDLNNLATLLLDANRLTEAEPLMRRALAISEQYYGTEHPKVAICRNNLAQLLKATNRLAEAEFLMRRALAISEQSHGIEHPHVAICLNNLAWLLKETNCLAEAEPLMRRALAIDEQSYGAEHPAVARDLNNLALLLQDTNRLAEAEPLMRRALALDEQSYGAEHPSVAGILNSLALLLQATNRLAEAEPLMRRALSLDEQSYGAEHPNVGRDLSNVAWLLKETNRLSEAEPLMARVVTIFEKSYGECHPKVAIALNNLAQLLKATNRLANAEPLMRRVLTIVEQSYGAEHPHVATALNNLAALLQATNRLVEAEPLIRRALAIDEQSYGAEHPDVAIRLNNLAGLLMVTNRLAEAEPLMRRCVTIDATFGRKSGHEHPRMQTDLANFRAVLQAMKLQEDEIGQRLKDATVIVGPLKPIVPAVERLLGPAKPVADVLAELDRQYKAEDKPPIYFLRPDQPIAPHLNQLLGRSQLDVPLNELIVPHLEKLLGPAKSTREVFETLDRQYREQNKSEIWFLPLSQPIAPHLDELLGPLPKKE